MKSRVYQALSGLMFKQGILLILLAIVLLMGLLTYFVNGNFSYLSVRNLFNIVNQGTVIAIMAIGVTQVIISGGIDLSGGSALALIGVVVASFAQADPNTALLGIGGLPIVVPILVGILVGTGIGAFNGYLLGATGIPPFIVTLGGLVSLRGLALIYSRGNPISNLSESFLFLSSSFMGIPIPVIVLVIMAVVFQFLMKNTRYGKYTYAVGGNEQAAYISGINIKKQKILIYAAAGFATAIAAILYTSRVASGQPASGQSFELDAIASAVIGGTSLAGGVGVIYYTVIGALIIQVMNNGLQFLNVDGNFQYVLKGVIIVVAVIIDKIKVTRQRGA